MSRRLVTADGGLVAFRVEGSAYAFERSRDAGPVAPIAVVAGVGFQRGQNSVRVDALLGMVNADVFGDVKTRVGPRAAVRAEERFPDVVERVLRRVGL